MDIIYNQMKVHDKMAEKTGSDIGKHMRTLDLGPLDLLH